MPTTKFPRTEKIMILVRKAVNCPHGDKAALKHLSDAHDAVEDLEKALIRAEAKAYFPAPEDGR